MVTEEIGVSPVYPRFLAPEAFTFSLSFFKDLPFLTVNVPLRVVTRYTLLFGGRDMTSTAASACMLSTYTCGEHSSFQIFTGI